GAVAANQPNRAPNPGRFAKGIYPGPMKKTLLLLFILAIAGVVLGQRRRWGGWGGDEGRDTGIVYTEPPNSVPVDTATVRTAREIASHSTDTPNWTNTPGFEKDVVTFVRVLYHRGSNRSGSGWGWVTDFPDSDLNLSFRLQQVTSM